VVVLLAAGERDLGPCILVGERGFDFFIRMGLLTNAVVVDWLQHTTAAQNIVVHSKGARTRLRGGFDLGAEGGESILGCIS